MSTNDEELGCHPRHHDVCPHHVIRGQCGCRSAAAMRCSQGNLYKALRHCASENGVRIGLSQILISARKMYMMNQITRSVPTGSSCFFFTSSLYFTSGRFLNRAFVRQKMVELRQGVGSPPKTNGWFTWKSPLGWKRRSTDPNHQFLGGFKHVSVRGCGQLVLFFSCEVSMTFPKSCINSCWPSFNKNIIIPCIFEN